MRVQKQYNCSAYVEFVVQLLKS
ncbi:protein of unknown function [Streptococcus thermophilus]|nr:protein of unknown function [Streptococcus thermophilus]